MSLFNLPSINPSIGGSVGYYMGLPVTQNPGIIPQTRWVNYQPINYTPIPAWSGAKVNPVPAVNPGMIAAKPTYQTTSPVQAQYYWGNQPAVTSTAQLANPPKATNIPAQPWGLQQGPQPFNLNAFLQNLNAQYRAPTPVAPVAPVTVAVRR